MGSVLKGVVMCVVTILLCITSEVFARDQNECTNLCNDLQYEVLTLEMCRNAKKTLPRPKVGDFCQNAMEQGFSDSCIPLCMGEKPQNRIAQACRAANVEMPRPTVRKWCEHGYNEAFNKGTRDLKDHFTMDALVPDVEVERELEEVKGKEEEVAQTEEEEQEEEKEEEGPAITTTVPVTLEDGSTHDLIVYEGQNAEEAVVTFCREKVPDDVSSCIRQLVSVVLEKLEE